MSFLSKHKKDISSAAFFLLIIIEIVFIFRPFVSSPVKGLYKCNGEYIRIKSDTYVTERQKGFYYFYDGLLNWEREEYGYAAIVLDNGDIYGIKSAFSIRNIDTDNTLVSGRAIFIQVVIAVLFAISVYFAFIQRDIPRQNKAKDDDDDWDTRLLKN